MPGPLPGTGQAQAQAEPEDSGRIMVHLYRNGFTVNNGALRNFTDPENVTFLQFLGRGELPPELARLGGPAEKSVDLVRVNDDYKPPPEPKYLAFKGEGRTLGGGSAPAAPAPASAPVAAEPSQGPVLDEGKPVTSIQLRLADGSRLVARFNHDHTVGDIRRYINAQRPGSGAYTLQTPGFPPKKLDQEGQSIEEAGLVNSVVIQR